MSRAFSIVVVRSIVNLLFASGTSCLAGLASALWSAILKHRNITTTLPRAPRFRGLEKAPNPFNAKAAIPKNGGFHIGQGLRPRGYGLPNSRRRVILSR